MNYRPIDTEALISEIENRRFIWDTSLEEYRDRDLKNKAFEEIAAKVIDDFNTLCQTKKQEAVALTQKRWKTARDAYVRDCKKLKECKTAEEERKIKRYIHFEKLRFLDQVMNLTLTDVEENTNSENDGNAAQETSTSPSAVRSLQRRDTTLKQDNLDEALLSFLQDCENMEQDDDAAFLVSLLPTLKAFDETKKLQFRSEVLRILMEIKNIPRIDVFRAQSDMSNIGLTPEPSPSDSFSTLSTSDTYCPVSQEYCIYDMQLPSDFTNQYAAVESFGTTSSTYRHISSESSRPSAGYSCSPSPSSISNSALGLSTLLDISGSDIARLESSE